MACRSLFKADRCRTEEELKDLLAERLLRLQSILLPGDLLVWKVVHMVCMQLKGKLVQIILHVRNVAEEVTRHQFS